MVEGGSENRWRRPALSWAGLLLASPIAALSGGLANAYTVTISALFALGFVGWSEASKRPMRNSEKLIALGAVGFWLVAVAGVFVSPAIKLWPLEDAKGESIAMVVGLGLPLFAVLVRRVQSFRATEVDLVERAAIACLLSMAVIFTAEILTNQAWVRMSWEPLPADAIDPTIAYRENLYVGAMGRGATAFSLWLFPVAALLVGRGWVWRGLALAMLAAVGAASLRADHAAMTLALIAGSALFVAGLILPRLVSAASAAFVGLSTLVMPLLSAQAGRLIDSGASASLPYSWEVRMYIWRFTHDQVLQKPIFGHGVESGREFEGTFELRGFTFEAISHHPHNFALQIWHDLGGVAAAFFAWVCFGVSLWLWRAKPSRQAGAAFASALAAAWVVASLSYGLWQEWWLATLAVLAGLVCLVFRKSAELPR